jgi:DNA-binding NarL/FixJ family response regulator
VRLLRKVVDATPVLLSYWGADERNLFANEAYARWFGRSPDDLKGLDLRELLGDDAYDDDREHVRAVLNGAPQQFEKDVVGRAGAVRAQVTCTPDVARGRVIGFSVVVTTTAPTVGGEPALAADGQRLQVRALVVDDDPLERAGLRAILASAPDIDVVGEAADVAEALAAVWDASPEVVVMDVHLPRMEEFLATRRAFAPGGATFPEVVALTRSTVDEFLFDPLGAGASAVLAKRSSPEELIEAVRKAARDDLGVRHNGRGTPNEPVFARAPWRPTPRERDVLELASRGFSNAEIARRLYVSVDTVKTHMKHLYAKLGLGDRQELIAAACDVGLHRDAVPSAPAGLGGAWLRGTSTGTTP